MRPRHILLGIAVIAAVAVAAAERLNLDMKPEVAGASTPPAAPPAMPVPVTSVVTATVPITLDYAARTESIRAISLQAKVSAYIKDQPAPDGADVKANDLLYRLDPRDFQVALDQANAQVERDAASLDYQRSNFQRGDSLAKSGWLAKDNFDERSSTLRQAEAALTLARASVRGAQLSLDYTQIRAPFAGRLGRNQAPVGTLIGVGGTVLNTLVQLDPIYVTFNPSETDLVALSTARGAGTVKATISVPGQAEGAAHQGELTFIDNVVDRATGTVTARATIANADFGLLPGQYVRVRLHLRDQADALLVPQAAVGSSQLGKYVFVVGANSAVEQRMVRLGTVFGDKVSILSGISAGDKIIIGNLQKIGPGMPVQALPEKPASPS